MESRLFKRLELIEDLPTIPLVIRKIEEAIEDPDASPKIVAAVIEDDPAIMARILKVVNSVFYRPLDGREITSLSVAIARLGFGTIRNIALTTTIFSMFSGRKVSTFDLNEFWVHCISTGIINNIVYETCGGNMRHLYARDELHLIGLLHDIGKIILEQYFRDDFTRILKYSHENKVHISKAEEHLLGVTHAQIGGWLARKWLLPPLFVNTILYHHAVLSAPQEHLEPTAITHISDFICLKGRIGYSGSETLPPFEGKVWKNLGLNNEMLTEILDRAAEESKKSALLLSLL
jgi:HD-like signal output (HDOD) protein